MGLEMDGSLRRAAGFWLAVLASLVIAATALAEPVIQPPDYPQSLQRDLDALLAAQAATSRDPRILITLAGLYLDIGDNLLTDKAKRIAAYEEGARIARRAIEIREPDADAHFLYAATLGTAAQLKGVMASALIVRDIKAHTARALELRPDHPAALHMMGMMLEELPWILGGDAEAGLTHVQRAVAVAPGYAHARLDLAKLYLSRNNVEAAKKELRAVLALHEPSDPYAWTRRYRPEAAEMLATLERGGGNGAKP